MGKDGTAPDEPADRPFDRMMRFGTALFAVRKDELPKRDEREKTKRKRRANDNDRVGD